MTILMPSWYTRPPLAEGSGFYHLLPYDLPAECFTWCSMEVIANMHKGTAYVYRCWSIWSKGNFKLICWVPIYYRSALCLPSFLAVHPLPGVTIIYGVCHISSPHFSLFLNWRKRSDSFFNFRNCKTKNLKCQNVNWHLLRLINNS